MLGRATIRLGIGPHSSLCFFSWFWFLLVSAHACQPITILSVCFTVLLLPIIFYIFF